MKKVSILLIAVCFFLTGCGEDPENTISSIASTIEKNTGIQNLHTLSLENAQKQFKISEEEVQTFVVRTTYTDADLTEYGVFYVNDEKYLKDVKNKIKKHTQEVASRMKKVDNSYYDIAKEAVIKEKDNYIFYSIAENQEAMKTVFLGYFEQEQPKDK
ncbi:DUF4358 domain-containing protein [Bacillus cereus]|uniref:DUF4358 domain-containing protein n=1 Tax=Bacillus cereus TaxID=1396 RepID=UPI0010BF592F|nr:DUF4358 domain-containing protein [Bacillus cereus]TKH73422.1 DUF4358 domain-containing protein [Bacillus cereus]